MTVGLAAGIVNNWLDTDFATAGMYVQLHTGDPGAAGSTSISAGSTSRVQATMAAASGGTKAMSSMASNWTNGGTSETLSHISLHSASSAGTFKGSSALGVAQPWNTGNTFTLTSLSVAITPIAA